MVFFLRSLAALAISGAVLSGLAAQPANPEKLFILAEENGRPYTFVEDGRMRGMDYDLVVEAAKRMKIPVTIEFVPWKRMELELRKGGCDAAMTMFHVAERESFGVYVYPPLHYSTFVVFVRKGGEFPFSSIADLKGKTVGKVRGYSISADFDRAAAEGLFRVEEASSNLQNLQKLVAGRLDCVVTNLDYTLMEMKREGLSSSLTYLPTPVDVAKAAYLVLSRAGPDIADKEGFAARIGAALLDMQLDGTMKKIMDAYLR